MIYNVVLMKTYVSNLLRKGNLNGQPNIHVEWDCLNKYLIIFAPKNVVVSEIN